MLFESIRTEPVLFVRQRKELAELFGFETRNKYEVLTHDGRGCGFIAEQNKGFLGTVMRQVFGHWRTFTLHFFDANRNVVFVGHHPFRWFFQRLEVDDSRGVRVGALQRRFAIFSKVFDVEDAAGRVVMHVSSPFWRMWTFPFMRGNEQVGVLRKKWSGALKEFFTDADNFQVEYGPSASEADRILILAASVYVDLMYFENNQGSGAGGILDVLGD